MGTGTQSQKKTHKEKDMKKLFSFLLALVLMVGTITPVLADTTLKPGEKMIDVNVHKILMSQDQMDAHKKKTDAETKYDPTKTLEDQGKTLATYFGDSAKAINGVYFVAVDEEDPLYSKTDAVLKASDITDWATREANGMAGLTKNVNGQDGVLQLKLKSPGKYKIFEVKDKSTYVGPDKALLAKQLAVPVVLELPKHAQTPNGIADAIHVYPKNTEDTPPLKKEIETGVVTEINGEKVTAQSFDKDEEHTWKITTKVPVGVKDYDIFNLEDDLDAQLSYVKGKVVVKVGDTTLTENTDYKLTEPTEAKGGKLIIDFKVNDSLAHLTQHEGKEVTVEFVTTINDDAKMSTNIPNEIKLHYGHTPNPQEKKSEKPVVYTGGKKFIKIDPSKTEGEEGRALKDAQFVIRRSDGKYLVEKDGKYSWVKIDNVTTNILVSDKTGPNEEPLHLKKITSGSDGTFEIKGLKYERPNGSKYYLVEIVAPKDYALPTNNITDPFEFTVDDTSYANGDALVKPQEVNNTKIEIPKTGGIGTVIFTVVGIGLMAGAFIAMRKRTAEEN